MRNKALILSLLSLLCLTTFCYAGNVKVIPKVYYMETISPEAVVDIFNILSPQIKGKTALKVHFGEEGNPNYLKANMAELLCKKLNATLVETNVLYGGKRRNTATHIQLAKDHGFIYAPIDILDSEAETFLKTDSKHFDKVRVGSHLDKYQTVVVFSHFKGHGSAGFGGAIKNISMGLASIGGKLALHANLQPVTIPKNCTQCGACVQECPVGAISINPLVLDKNKCISCGKCPGVCPTRSIRVPWGNKDPVAFLERLADYAKSITKDRNMLYINVLMNISPDCDCSRNARKPFVKDIGILASYDPLALDKASLDLVNKAWGNGDAFLECSGTSGNYLIEYGAKIGLGSDKYQLIKIK